jgi:hypothetical protein
MYYEASRDFQNVFLPLKFFKTEEQAIADAKSAGDSKYFPALEKVIFPHIIKLQYKYMQEESILYMYIL